MLAMFAFELVLAILPSKLMITGHEGDLMHMLDASLRMVGGERPHLDFMTPIGILGFAPVAWFLALGFGAGKATLLAQIFMLACLLPFIWWVGATRLTRGQAYFFAITIIVFMTSVVFGGGTSTISLSMYYNRWGWSLTFILLATIMLAPRRPLAEAWLAPLVVAGCMAALAMLKMTFFVPLLPVVVVVLLVQKQGGFLLKALAFGLAIGLGLLFWLGLDFFIAYFENLLAVTRPESARVNTGVSLSEIVASPGTLLGTLVLFLTLILFRKSGRMNQGLFVLLLAPAFAYITYQNWGNDPKWLLFLALYIWANLPEPAAKPLFGVPARQGGVMLIVICLSIMFPSIFSMASTPIRVAAASKSEGYSKLEMKGGVSDIWLPERRISDILAVQAVPGWPPLSPDLDPLEISGFTFPDCKLHATLVAQYEGMAAQIEQQESLRGQPVIVADVLNFLWLIGDVGRVQGAAPWYYGDSSGLAQARFMAVPLCPMKPDLRLAMVSRARENGYGFQEVFRSDLMVVYALIRPPE